MWMVTSLVVVAAIAGCTTSQYKSARNLVFVGAAISSYQNQHGEYPPAVVLNDHGTPITSWRTLVAPILNGESVPFDFKEPWNSPKNSKLIEEVPFDLVSARWPPKKGCTSYVAVTGPGTIWDAENRKKSPDDSSIGNSIMIVELPDSDIVWTEPRDMTFEEFLAWWEKVRIDYRNDPPLVVLEDGLVMPLTDENVAKAKQIHDAAVAKRRGSQK